MKTFAFTIIGVLTALFCVAQPTNALLINSEGLIVFFDRASGEPKLFWSGTASFFLNDDGLITTMDPNLRGLVVQNEAIVNAFSAKECRPSTQDIQGNWGPVSDGLQMSIRFERASYPLRENIQADIILRNVTNEIRHFDIERAGDRNLWLNALDHNGRSVGKGTKSAPTTAFRERLSEVSHGHFQVFIRPGTQRKMLIEATDLLSLSRKGEYRIWGVRRIPNLNLRMTNEILTGKATIRIE